MHSAADIALIRVALCSCWNVAIVRVSIHCTASLNSKMWGTFVDRLHTCVHWIIVSNCFAAADSLWCVLNFSRSGCVCSALIPPPPPSPFLFVICFLFLCTQVTMNSLNCLIQCSFRQIPLFALSLYTAITSTRSLPILIWLHTLFTDVKYIVHVNGIRNGWHIAVEVITHGMHIIYW